MLCGYRITARKLYMLNVYIVLFHFCVCDWLNPQMCSPCIWTDDCVCYIITNPLPFCLNILFYALFGLLPHFLRTACLDMFFQEKVLMGTWRLEFDFLFPYHSHCITMVTHLYPINYWFSKDQDNKPILSPLVSETAALAELFFPPMGLRSQCHSKHPVCWVFLLIFRRENGFFNCSPPDI